MDTLILDIFISGTTVVVFLLRLLCVNVAKQQFNGYISLHKLVLVHPFGKYVFSAFILERVLSLLIYIAYISRFCYITEYDVENLLLKGIIKKSIPRLKYNKGN